MISFTAKKIKHISNLGDVLKKKRQELGMNLTQISKRTLIAERYLQAIENEDWQRLPGEVYIKNFLKRYAMELGLDLERVLKSYTNKNSTYETSIYSLQRTLPLAQSNFLNIPKLLRNSVLILVVLLFIGYLGWQTNKIITPPELNIYSPVDNLVTSEGKILIQGKTEPEVEVAINNMNIPVNNGKFYEELDLQQGLNVLKITARKKYSRQQVIYRKIMWKPNDISKY